MASTEAGPSDSEAQKKPTAGQRKAERAAKVREKQEASKRLLGDYNDLTKQIQGTVDLNEGQTFGTVLQRLNGLHTRISVAKEQQKDGEVFHLLCQKGVDIVRQKVGGEKFRTPADLIRCLKAQYVASAGGNGQEEGATVPEAFNWAALAQGTAQYFKHAPGLSCMLGPMDAAPKVRKQVNRQPRQKLEKLVAAEDVDSVPEEQEEVIRNMNEIWKGITERPEHAANVLQCVINHRSFSQTVENMFALSFLVRDGRVTVTKAANGQGYTVTALDPKTMERLKKGKERSQVILSLDMYDWEDWCTRVQPGDCLMSHRPPAHIPGAPHTPNTGGPESSRIRKQQRQTQAEADDQEEEEEEEDEEAAALRRKKGKKKARIQD